MAYDRLEPIGPRRLDLLFAQLAFTIYHAIRLQDTKMESKPYEEFIPEWGQASEGKEEPETQDSNLGTKAATLFGMLGGRPVH